MTLAHKEKLTRQVKDLPSSADSVERAMQSSQDSKYVAVCCFTLQPVAINNGHVTRSRVDLSLRNSRTESLDFTIP